MPASHVQTAWNETASGESISVTLTLTAGNGVVVTLMTPAVGSASLVGLAQTSGDTLLFAAGIDNSGTYQQQYSKTSVAGGSTTFTFTWGGATQASLYVTEISSLSTFDQSASTPFAITPTPSSGTTGALDQADEIAIATFNLDGSGSTAFTSVSNGFTVPANGNHMGGGIVGGRSLLAYKVVADTSAVETTLTGDNMAVTGLVCMYRAASDVRRFLLVRN